MVVNTDALIFLFQMIVIGFLTGAFIVVTTLTCVVFNNKKNQKQKPKTKSKSKNEMNTGMNKKFFKIRPVCSVHKLSRRAEYFTVMYVLICATAEVGFTLFMLLDKLDVAFVFLIVILVSIIVAIPGFPQLINAPTKNEIINSCVSCMNLNEK